VAVSQLKALTAVIEKSGWRSHLLNPAGPVSIDFYR